MWKKPRFGWTSLTHCAWTLVHMNMSCGFETFPMITIHNMMLHCRADIMVKKSRSDREHCFNCNISCCPWQLLVATLFWTPVGCWMGVANPPTGYGTKFWEWPEPSRFSFWSDSFIYMGFKQSGRGGPVSCDCPWTNGARKLTDPAFWVTSTSTWRRHLTNFLLMVWRRSTLEWWKGISAP